MALGNSFTVLFFSLLSSYIMPHQPFIDSGWNLADISYNPDFDIVYLPTVTPENDPTRIAKWNGPWYPSYGIVSS